MKRILSVFLLSLFLLSLTSCSGGGISRIEFSGTTATEAQRKIEYDFSEISSKAAELDTSFGAPPMLNNIDKDYDKDALLNAFNMGDVDREKMENTTVKAYRYVDGDKRLIVHEDGFIAFYNTALYEKAPTLTDSEYKALAEDVIKKLGLDMSELTPQEMTDADGRKFLYYSRKINGMTVVGNTGLYFYFEGDGISIFKQQCSTYSGETAFEPIGVKAALDTLLTDKSAQSFGREKTTAKINTVKVTSVSLVYWDSFKSQISQTHIQPVYLFHGIATDADGIETEFTGYVRAVSDDITASFGVSHNKDEYF